MQRVRRYLWILFKFCVLLAVLFPVFLYIYPVYASITLDFSRLALRYCLGYYDLSIELRESASTPHALLADRMVFAQLLYAEKSWELSGLRLFSGTLSFLALALASVRWSGLWNGVKGTLVGLAVIWLLQVLYVEIISVGFFTFAVKSEPVAKFLYMLNWSVAFVVWTALFKGAVPGVPGAGDS